MINKQEALSLTRRIRLGINNIADLVSRAYTGRVWLALGYKTWDEYVEGEFGSAPLVVPRENRRAVIQSLADSGMSSRAISTVTGVSQSTASRAVLPGDQPVMGLDGRLRPRKPIEVEGFSRSMPSVIPLDRRVGSEQFALYDQLAVELYGVHITEYCNQAIDDALVILDGVRGKTA